MSLRKWNVINIVKHNLSLTISQTTCNPQPLFLHKQVVTNQMCSGQQAEEPNCNLFMHKLDNRDEDVGNEETSPLCTSCKKRNPLPW